jgi:hypothetical protein
MAGSHSFLWFGVQVGNQAVPVNASFLVDTAAPTFDNIMYPRATNAQSVTLTFTVTDGALGSGVQEVKCRLRAQKLATNGTASSQGWDWQNCSSPQLFEDLLEGRWSLQLQAQDLAQNVRITRRARYPLYPVCSEAGV